MQTISNKEILGLQISKPKHGVVTIEVSVSPETLDEQKTLALAEIKRNFRAQGFRDGHVPESIVLEHVHEHHLLEEAAERVIRKTYPTVIEESKLHIISSPKITLKKLALGNPFEFSIEVAIYPEVKLPNYIKIAKKVREAEKPIEVSGTEIDGIIEELQTMRKPEGGEKPELNDEFAKSVGPFENLADLREKIRKNMEEEKKMMQSRERREKIAEAIAVESKTEIPEPAIADEVASARREFTSALEERKMTEDDYLKQVGKTKETFESEEHTRAEKRLKVRFIIQEIAKEKKLEPKDEDIEHELSHARSHFKDAREEDLRAFIRGMLVQDMVLSFLEDPEAKNETN